jgi:hypothetical protein
MMSMTVEPLVEWELAGEPSYLKITYSSTTLSTTNPTRPDLRSNPGRHNANSAINLLSYGMYPGCSCISYEHHSLMELSPSWEATNCAATREIPRILCHPKIYYRVQNSPPHLSLSSSRSIQFIASHTISLRSIWILSAYLRLGLPSGLFPSGFLINILYAFLFSPFVLHFPSISSSLAWSF